MVSMGNGLLIGFAVVVSACHAASPWILALAVLLWLAVYDSLFPLLTLHKPKDFAHAKSRRFGLQVPPPYPNGWYMVLYSFELTQDVQSVCALGRELAVWRSKTTGKVSVFGAYCPHLGANLSVEGKVEGDCLKCPFHGWKFHGCDGSTKAQGNQAEVYLCQERNGMILIWLDGKRDAARRGRAPAVTATTPEQPDWEVDDGLYDPLVHGQFVGMVEHELCAHISEIPENGADGNHLGTVHAPFVLERLSGWLDHDWKFTWTPNLDSPALKHTAVVDMNLGLRVKHWGLVDALAVHVHVVQTGPALVFEQLTLPLGLGTVYFCSSVTPVSPKLLRYTHAMYCSNWLPRIVAKTLLRGLQVQVNRDVPIWNNKTYRAKPPLTKEDGDAISRFRQWFSQFYSPESETFEQALEWERGQASHDW